MNIRESKLLLGDVSPSEFAEIIRSNCGRNPLPYLHDPQVHERAVAEARRQDLFKFIEEEIESSTPVAVLPYTAWAAYRKRGWRDTHDGMRMKRSEQLELARMGCFLGMDYFDYLHDLLWAECECSTWVGVSHVDHSSPIDLFAAMLAADLALTLALFGDRIDQEVRERVREEINRRVLEPFLDPATDSLWWRTVTNNWNAVCHGDVGAAALLIEDNPDRLVRILLRILQDLPHFIDGFTEDGGCSEGPTYWRFGFGRFVRLAEVLHSFTDGRINIMRGEKMERICRYPLAATLAPGQDYPYSDAYTGYQPLAPVCRINRFYSIPELFGLCRLREDGLAVVDSLESLLLYDGHQIEPLSDTHDYVLPGVGLAIIRAGAVAFAIKAGRNDEHHNHNDVGSFVVHRGRTQFLSDPGAPIYTAKTFGPQRYESPFTSSYGHSVPVIDGKQQQPGGQFRGDIVVAGANSGDHRRVQVEMTSAYAVPSLARLTRTVDVPPHDGEIVLTDTFELTDVTEVEEAFITYLPAVVEDDGRSVVIHSSEDGSARLRAIDTAGSFRVDVLQDSVAESSTGCPITRIVFSPDSNASHLVLTFGVTLSVATKECR